MKTNVYRYPAAALLAAALLVVGPAWSQGTAPDAGIPAIQQDWATIQYASAASAREAQFEALAARAHAISERQPDRAEPHIWEGIVLSSWANARGGLGALDLARRARKEFEAAIAINPAALNGSALSSLAVLYYKVPRWPLGFGDKEKAQALFQQALAVDPDAIDTNYFYADYLLQQGDKEAAKKYLGKALAARPRPGRETADAGRREDIRKLQAEINSGK